MHLDDLKYGTLTRTQVAQLRMTSPLFKCTFEQLPRIKPPSNSAQKTAQELRLIQLVMDRKPLPEDFVKACDQDIMLPFEKRLHELGMPIPVWTQELLRQVVPYTLYLKEAYQRPRPFQLALYTGADLHALPTSSGHSPSYPSGHSMQAIIMALALTRCYGDHGFLTIAKAVSLSRIQLGVHYPSDKTYGEYLGYWLFKQCNLALR
jgi:hypothetical protein